MIARSKTAPRRAVGVFLTAFVLIAVSIPTASSQGVFDTLLGAFNRPAMRERPPQVRSYAEPLALSGPALEKKSAVEAAGPWTAYCVRLCDGRFFPLQRSSSISPADQCRSFCPAAKTKVLGGNGINHAVAADGTRYANLENAFLYRTRMVDNCTCNGRDAFGLASMDISADPTLRAGDIVAIDGKFVAFTGAKSARHNSDFTPIEKYSGLSSEMRRKLSQTKVLPARQTENVSAAIADGKSESMFPRREDRRAQLFR